MGKRIRDIVDALYKCIILTYLRGNWCNGFWSYSRCSLQNFETPANLSHLFNSSVFLFTIIGKLR